MDELKKLQMVINSTITSLDQATAKDIQITIQLRKARIELAKLNEEIEKRNNEGK